MVVASPRHTAPARAGQLLVIWGRLSLWPGLWPCWASHSVSLWWLSWGWGGCDLGPGDTTLRLWPWVGLWGCRDRGQGSGSWCNLDSRLRGQVPWSETQLSSWTLCGHSFMQQRPRCARWPGPVGVVASPHCPRSPAGEAGWGQDPPLLCLSLEPEGWGLQEKLGSAAPASGLRGPLARPHLSS